jgi:hypothetical protein
MPFPRSLQEAGGDYRGTGPRDSVVALGEGQQQTGVGKEGAGLGEGERESDGLGKEAKNLWLGGKAAGGVLMCELKF